MLFTDNKDSVFTEHPKSNVPKGSIADQIKVNFGFLQVR